MEVWKPKCSTVLKCVAKTKQNLENEIYETPLVQVNCHNSEFFNVSRTGCDKVNKNIDKQYSVFWCL